MCTKALNERICLCLWPSVMDQCVNLNSCTQTQLPIIMTAEVKVLNVQFGCCLYCDDSVRCLFAAIRINMTDQVLFASDTCSRSAVRILCKICIEIARCLHHVFGRSLFRLYDERKMVKTVNKSCNGYARGLKSGGAMYSLILGLDRLNERSLVMISNGT